MYGSKWFILLALVTVLGLLAGCAQPTPQVIEQTVVVKEVVTEVVKETVVVEGAPQIAEQEVTKIVEVEKVVTPN